MVKDDNYYTVFYWFIHELGLKGAELPVFAIIHSFSQDGTSKFSGSLNYLADFAGLTRQGVIKVLKKLIKRGYVLKEQTVDNGVKCNSYKVNFEVVNRVDIGSKQSLQGWSTEFTGGSKQSLHNNKPYIDIDNNRDIDTMSALVNYWNENVANSTIKSITKINPNSQRYHNLNARVKEHGVDEIQKAIDNIAKSDFLNGKNNRGWTITFDWFVKPNNFIKVLEGDYTNAAKGSKYCEY